MRIVDWKFTKSQKIHLRVLKKILEEKKLKHPTTFDDQIEDVYAFFLTKAQSILSVNSVRDGVKKAHGGFFSDFDLMNIRFKHLEFRHFLIRISKLKAFAKMVDEAEKASEIFIKAMFRIAEKQAQKAVIDKQKQQGHIPEDINGKYGPSQPVDVEEDLLNSLPSEIQTAIADAAKDISDFSASFAFLNDSLEGIDECDPTPGNVHQELQDTTMWEERVRWLADKFDLKQTHIYSMARELTTEIESQQKTNRYKKAENLENIQNVDVEHSKDMTKATPVEQIKDDEEFFGKMAKGELQTRTFEEGTVKKQCLYVLCDASGSMLGKKQNMASAVIVSLCRKTAEKGDVFFLRMFDEGCHDRQDVISKGLAGKMERYVIDTGFTGGGTNIGGALRTAVSDIVKAEDEYKGMLSKAQILLLTDAEDSRVDGDHFRSVLDEHKIKLHTIVFGREHGGMDGLIKASDTFKFASVDTNGAMSIVDTVTV